MVFENDKFEIPKHILMMSPEEMRAEKAKIELDRANKIASEQQTELEILVEEAEILKIVNLLEMNGIKVKTEYGYYRPTYDVLKDVTRVIFGRD